MSDSAEFSPPGRVAGCGEQLPTQDVDELLRVVKARGRGGPRALLSQAMRSLAHKQHTAKVGQALGEVLVDKSVTTRERARAALHLRHIPAATAEPLLIGQLAAPEPSVRSAVLRSLAHVGDKQALAALQKLQKPNELYLEIQRSFAMQVIGHRLGVETPAPADPGKRWAPDAKRKAMGLKSLASSDGTKLLASLGSSAYGVALSPTSAVQFADPEARTPTHLVFTEEFIKRSTWEMMSRTPFVLGVLTHTHEQSKDITVWQVLLATPRPGRLIVRGYRSDGEVRLDGHALVKGDAIHFEMSSIEAPGQCRHHLAGWRREGTMTWEQHDSSPERLAKRVPIASKPVRVKPAPAKRATPK